MDSALRTVFITGAGRRLGLHLVKHYLSLGWRVIAHYRSKNELFDETNTLLEYDGRYFSLQADLSKPGDVERLCDELLGVVKTHKITLDSIIHNASCFFPDSTMKEFTKKWEEYQAMISVHAVAPKILTETLVEYMRDGSHITVLGDIYSDLPNSRFASYCSAKAAAQNLALSLAQQLAPKIRVNVIQPGPIKFLPEHDQAYRKKVVSQSLLKKELGYDSIQEGIDYLTQASSITGSTLRIDGGRACANRYEQMFN